MSYRRNEGSLKSEPFVSFHLFSNVKNELRKYWIKDEILVSCLIKSF